MTYSSIANTISEEDLVNDVKKSSKTLNLFAQEYSQEDLEIPRDLLYEVNVYMYKKEQYYQ